MPTLDELAKSVKRHIADGDASRSDADEHYAEAGRALIAAKKQVGRGNWLTWLKLNVEIKERRAQELMEIAKKKKTVAKLRADNAASKRASRQKKNAGHPAHLPPSACDFDWSNVTEADFGDPSKAYRHQAGFFRSEALSLARTYPLRSPKVDPAVITNAEIEAVREVAAAWSELVDILIANKQRKLKESA